MNRILLAAMLLITAFAARSLETVEHPDPDAFSPGVAKVFAAAQERLRRAQEDGEPSGDDFGVVGMIYQAHEQNVPAGQAYRNALERAPADARWPYFLGMLAVADGRFDDAERRYAESLEKNPDYIPARIRQARAMIQAGRTDEARALLELLADRYPRVAALKADLGTLAAQEGRPEEAVVRLEEALELQPEANRLHYPLALAYRALGDVDKARFHLDRQGQQEVVFDDPLLLRMRSLSGSYAYYMSLGLTAARNRDFPSALQFMQQAVAANPESPEARINLARMVEANGDGERAVQLLDEVIAGHPDNALAYFNRGAIHEVDGNDELAEVDYRAALTRQTDLFEARLLLASALMRRQAWSEAAREYRKGFELRPGRTELLMYEAVALQAADRCVDAVGSLLELVRRLPEDFGSLIAYARVASTCPAAGPEHRENALNAARNMYALAPELDVVTTLAMAEAAAGRFEAAVDYQTQAGFLALREAREEQVPQIRENLDRYESGQPATRPWGDDHPFLSPRRLTLEDRL